MLPSIRTMGSHNFYIGNQKSCKLEYLTEISSDWFSLNLSSQLSVCFRGKHTHTHTHHMLNRCGWESKQSQAVLHRQWAAAPPNKRPAAYNDIPRVIYVHIRKLNLMKRMSNKVINFIWGSSGCNFCLQSFHSGKTTHGAGTWLHFGGLWSMNSDIPHIVSQSQHWNACSRLPSSQSVHHSLPLMWKKNTPF